MDDTEPQLEHIDLKSYRIELTQTRTGLSANVVDLPGCVAGAATAVELQAAVTQAIYVYLEAHPDAPRHYLA